MDLAARQATTMERPLGSPRLSELGRRPARDIVSDAARIASWRCGRIVTESGRLVGIYGRWWPHLGNWLQVLWDQHIRTAQRDRCTLFYHQPIQSPNYLTLSYIQSGARTSLSTFFLSTLVLDEIAKIRGADAIVCNVTNDRITNRLMERWGWQPHCLHWKGRHFIKRFYGNYSDLPPNWRERLVVSATTPTKLQ